MPQNHALTLNVRGPSYLGLTRSISWLLMPWLLTSPGHQQPWYWLYRICRSFPYLRKCFKYLCQINVEDDLKCKYMVMFPQKNLACKGLTTNRAPTPQAWCSRHSVDPRQSSVALPAGVAGWPLAWVTLRARGPWRTPQTIQTVQARQTLRTLQWRWKSLKQVILDLLRYMGSMKAISLLEIFQAVILLVMNQGPDSVSRYCLTSKRKSHCADKTVVRSSYLHNGISYNSKMSSLYWISHQGPDSVSKYCIVLPVKGNHIVEIRES